MRQRTEKMLPKFVIINFDKFPLLSPEDIMADLAVLDRSESVNMIVKNHQGESTEPRMRLYRD